MTTLLNKLIVFDKVKIGGRKCLAAPPALENYDFIDFVTVKFINKLINGIFPIRHIVFGKVFFFFTLKQPDICFREDYAFSDPRYYENIQSCLYFQDNPR